MTRWICWPAARWAGATKFFYGQELFASNFGTNNRILKASAIVLSCVADPGHFGTDPDPHLELMDSDPDPAVFVIDLQDVKKTSFFKIFCLLLFEFTFTSYDFSKIKSHKEVRKQEESTFSCYFCFMMEESRSGATSD